MSSQQVVASISDLMLTLTKSSGCELASNNRVICPTISRMPRWVRLVKMT